MNEHRGQFEEALEFPEDSYAQRLREEGRILEALQSDPTCRMAFTACQRTVINGVITLLDGVSGIGEGGSLFADAAKIVKFYRHNSGLDFTPDVSLKVALGSEFFEVCSFGIAPTHGIETFLQACHDIPRIWRGGIRAGKLIIGRF